MKMKINHYVLWAIKIITVSLSIARQSYGHYYMYVLLFIYAANTFICKAVLMYRGIHLGYLRGFNFLSFICASTT